MSRDCRNLFEETKRYEEHAHIQSKFRMNYHLMPPVGWMNDPNGLCEYHGIYHVFFQYTPAAASGDGYRGWGHYTSEDLLHWTYEGLALAPDMPFDQDGAYSGSALTDAERMYLYYTGNVKEPGEHDYITSGRGANVILVESEDGIQMGEKKLLLTNADYPEDYSCHIRDPKVWKENDGYYMVLGGRTIDNQGKALVYRSDNKTDWKFIDQITTKEKFGFMWECPDVFSFNNKTFLSVSPQGVEAEEFKYQNVYQSGYFRLEVEDSGQCSPFDFKEWDMGFDFYAPQTFEDEKNRRILYGWAGIPDAEYTNRTVLHGWQHCLTLPREITEKGSILYQNPPEELKKLRRNQLPVPEGKLIETKSSYELCMDKKEFEWVEESLEKKGIGPMRITICGGLVLAYDGKKVLSLEFTSSIGDGRTVRKALLPRLNKIRMYMDVSIAEIFINDGELVFTTRLYPENYTLKIEAEHTQNILWEL